MDQDLVMWNGIVAFVLPLLIAVIQQPSFPKWAKATITLVASVIGAVVTTLLTDQWNTEDVVTSILTVLTGVIAFYLGFFKPTGITDGIQNATSRGGSTATPTAP